jgi:hypothetical protein
MPESYSRRSLRGGALLVSRCELCAADIDGGKEVCRGEYFGEVLAREYLNEEYGVEHSEDHGRSTDG